MSTLAATLAGAGLSVLLLGACGDDPGPSPAAPSATVGRSPTTPSSTTSRAPVVTLRGMVGHADVGSGCLVLRTAERTYVLVGDAARHLRVGSSVTVTGHEAANRMTSCQAGPPFEVVKGVQRT